MARSVKGSKIDASGAVHSPPRPLTLNSFFAGIGGFDLAFERAGIAPVYHCEKDKYCQSILTRHWPNVKQDSDVTKVAPADLPEADIWCGGFPCQDVSVARGSMGRDGLKGHRSGLFYTFLELIADRLPSVVLIENVTGLLNSHQGRDFDTILKSLTGLGYGVAWRVMNSRYFGAPQSRPRVFICAWLGSVKHAAHCLFESLPGYEAENERQGFLQPSQHKRSGICVPEVAYCLAATSGRHTGTDWSRSYVAYPDRVRRLTPTECEALQGFPKGWTIPIGQESRKSADDIDTLRYHALGNAVCVPVVEWIARRIATSLQPDGQRRHKHVPSISAQALAALVSTPRDVQYSFLELEERQQNLWEEDPVYKWKSGGCAANGLAATAPVLTGPSTPRLSKFIDIIETDVVDERFFLSPNAAEGILRRVNGQGRTLFAPLAAALSQLAMKKTKVSGVKPSLQTDSEPDLTNSHV